MMTHSADMTSQVLLIILLMSHQLVTARHVITPQQQQQQQQQQDSGTSLNADPSCTQYLEGTALDCDIYTCLHTQSSCNNYQNSLTLRAAHKFCVHVNKFREIDSNHRSDLVTEWSDRTNACMLEYTHTLMTSSHCDVTEFKQRRKFHSCATSGERSDICAALRTHRTRTEILKLFPHMDWLLLVELARDCPQRLVSNLIQEVLYSQTDSNSQ